MEIAFPTWQKLSTAFSQLLTPSRPGLLFRALQTFHNFTVSPFQSIKNLWIFCGLQLWECASSTYALKTSIFLFLVRKNQSESSEIPFACFSLCSNFRVTSAVLILGRNGSDFHYRPLFFWQNHPQSLIIARNRFKGLIQCFMINDFCWFLLFTLRESGRTRRSPRKSPPGNS